MLLTELRNDTEATDLEKLEHTRFQDFSVAFGVDNQHNFLKRLSVSTSFVVEVKHCGEEKFCLFESQPAIPLFVKRVKELFDVFHPVADFFLLQDLHLVFEIV